MVSYCDRTMNFIMKVIEEQSVLIIFWIGLEKNTNVTFKLFQQIFGREVLS